MKPTKLVLRALTGDLRGQEFTAAAPSQWVVGRSRRCSLRLPGDSTVSRQHCVVELEAGRAWVQDLGSLNGTLVNGAKVGYAPAQPLAEDATYAQAPRLELNDGDELRVCNNVFAVCLRRPDEV